MKDREAQTEFVRPDQIMTKRRWMKPAIEDFAPVTIARGGNVPGVGDGFSNIS